MPRKEICNCEPVKMIARMTPKEAGYFMPAEWAKHDATWMSWPKNPLTFPGEKLESVEDIFAKMVSALSGGETVRVLVDNDEMEARAERCISKTGADLSNVMFIKIRTADVWVRDYGPTYVLSRKGGLKGTVKWRFNAWGGKYDDLLYDDLAGEEIVRWAGLRSFRPNVVLEGGSIDVNGSGTVMTTEQCLLNKNRNPELSKGEIEGVLEDYLDVSKIIWLKSGIDGDDTDGHVDDFARFVSERAVLCAHSTSNAGENRSVLETNLNILRNATDQDGRALEVIKLPMPSPVQIAEEDRFLPASYANFYIGNKVVLLPVFDDENDREALEVLRSCFNGREIVPIEARDLVYGYGGFHCVTQQDPSPLN